MMCQNRNYFPEERLLAILVLNLLFYTLFTIVHTSLFKIKTSRKKFHLKAVYYRNYPYCFPRSVVLYYYYYR